jgi:hypothetical protein
VHALAPRDARKRDESELGQVDAQRRGRLDHARPRHRGVGIEVEHHEVGAIEPVGARAPDVQLEDADLTSETSEARSVTMA